MVVLAVGLTPSAAFSVAPAFMAGNGGEYMPGGG